MTMKNLLLAGLFLRASSLWCVGATIFTASMWMPNVFAQQAQPASHGYKVIEEWKIPNGGYGRAVVVKPNPVESELRALGEKLKQDTKRDRNAFIFIYDDEKAARNRRAAAADRLAREDLKHYDKHFVGTYFRNGNTGFHQLTITVKGLDGPSVEVKY